jgi:hypothetical protein
MRGRTRGCSWELDLNARNFAFLWMPAQEFGGRFSMNLWTGEAEP